jgi:hypothetical protein
MSCNCRNEERTSFHNTSMSKNTDRNPSRSYALHFRPYVLPKVMGQESIAKWERFRPVHCQFTV